MLQNTCNPLSSIRSFLRFHAHGDPLKKLALIFPLLFLLTACGAGADPGVDGAVGDDVSVDSIAADARDPDALDGRDAGDLPDTTDFDVADGVSTGDAADVADGVEPGDVVDAGDSADLPGDTLADDVADAPDSVTADVAETFDDTWTSDAPDILDATDPDAGKPDEGGVDTYEVSDQGGVGDGLAIRIVASNLTSGTDQSYDPGDGINILDGLNPDIVLVQEFNYGDNTAADYNSFVQTVIGAGYWAVDDSTFQIPNGVVSRWPITASGYWDDPNISNRELMWATIDIPGTVDIMAISVHLHTSPSADQVEAAQVIVTKVKAHRAANPGKFMYVVGGDFNGTSAVSTSGFGEDDTFYTDPPDPVDDDGNYYTNANRNSQYDYVLGDPAMHGFQVPVVFKSTQDSTSRTYPDGLVFDTRTFTQSVLDEYFPPADTGDSSASSMQHMAIVKDYLIQ